MAHVRIASYALTKGTAEEAAKLAEEGLLPVFRSEPGFVSYSVAQADSGSLISLSVWQSYEDARKATAVAADWVAANMDDRLSLEWSTLADTIFDSDALVG